MQLSFHSDTVPVCCDDCTPATASDIILHWPIKMAEDWQPEEDREKMLARDLVGVG